MTVIIVCELLQTTSLLSPDKGRELTEKIRECLQDDADVMLDFRECEYLSSSFLNEAIGKQLIENQWTAAEFKARIQWQNLSEDAEIDLALSLENAETKLHLIRNDIDPEEFYNNNLPDV